MTISTGSDDNQLASVVGAIPGVRRLYSAHPTVVAVAASVIASTGRPNPAGSPLMITGKAVKVRIGIDDTRSTAQVGADVYEAIQAYLRSSADEFTPTIEIEIEIATIR